MIPEDLHEITHKERLLNGAEAIQFYVAKEFSLARLHLDEFQWNASYGGGIFLNFPFQLFRVVIGDWISDAELIDTDMIAGFQIDGRKSNPALEPKVHRLILAYANHLASGTSRDALYAVD